MTLCLHSKIRSLANAKALAVSLPVVTMRWPSYHHYGMTSTTQPPNSLLANNRRMAVFGGSNNSLPSSISLYYRASDRTKREYVPSSITLRLHL